MPATPPFISVALTNGQTMEISLQSVAYVRQDPLNASACFFGTYSQEPTEPWHVALSADAFTAQLVAAQGISPLTNPGAVLFAGVIAGNGTLLGGYVAPGVSFTTGPYVPGSGQYSFSVNGLGPIGMAFAVTQRQGPALQAVLAATQINPTQFEVWGDSIPGGAWGDWAFDLIVYRL